MTIGTSTSRVSFACDGTTKIFPVPIQAYLATDFTVMLTASVALGGAQTTLTLNSDYNLATSGTLTPTAWTLTTLAASAYLTGYTLQVFCNPVQTQQTQYVQGQAFPSLAVQTNIDRLTQMVQRLQDQVSRAVRAPDGDPSPGMLLPAVALRASMYLATDVNSNITTTAALPGTANTPASLGPIFNPLSPAEILAGTAPAANNYVYPAVPFLDARRYGWLISNTAAQNATALTTAITALNGLGGTIILPPGTFALNPVVIPQYVVVRGAGKRGTLLTHTNASGEVLFTLGGTSGTLYYGCGLTDLSILLTGTAGTCVLAQGTCGAEIARLYLEGETVSAGRTTKGVVIDGANASAFFNAVRDVQTNHLHSGFGQKTSGSLNPTQNYFTNCQAFGDVATDTTSEGVAHGDGINSGVGQLSVYEHCNFENCGTGMHFYGFCGPAVHVGCRFEGGTLDVLYDLNASAQTFVGGNPGLTTGLVTNNSLANSNYIGGWAGSNAAVYSQFGLVRAQAGAVTDVNYRADMWAAQTGNISEIRNSSTTLVGGVSPSLDNLTPVQRVFGVRSISGTITPGNNLRGTANFAAATTVAVAFAVNEPDSAYTVALGGNLAGFCWVTSKATTGFTINCSASNSNPTDWHLIR